MEQQISYGALAIGLCLVGWASWRERRPRKAVMPGLVPTTPIMFGGTLIALLALIHLMTLWGVVLPQR